MSRRERKTRQDEPVPFWPATFKPDAAPAEQGDYWPAESCPHRSCSCGTGYDEEIAARDPDLRTGRWRRTSR